MKKSDIEIINLNDEAKCYVVALLSSRYVMTDNPDDTLVEIQRTTTSFSSYKKALDYFYDNTFKCDMIIDMLDKNWGEASSYECEIKLIASTLVNEAESPDLKEEICAVYTAEYKEDEEDV